MNNIQLDAVKKFIEGFGEDTKSFLIVKLNHDGSIAYLRGATGVDLAFLIANIQASQMEEIRKTLFEKPIEKGKFKVVESPEKS